VDLLTQASQVSAFFKGNCRAKPTARFMFGGAGAPLAC
jgi:hypothetical protein